ncbi:attacin-B-like [Zootermopsis nevadensis]|uniref:Attacin-A n=1 Tax=Zootermopsis nevadensis TaxID=136037 RepID=A0A067RGW4_ZOONE|nr:attacin-B-like [Zootermopsis nevadensis]KDR23017.1 Attacin-A [Zootermopsis nevadensis]
MKLALVIASLIAALGFAPSARAYVPYVLKHKGLEPWGHDVVVMPIKEKTLQGEDVEISLPEEDNNYLLTPVIVADEPKSRVRRQVTVDLSRDSVSAQAQGNLWRRGPHSLDGNVHWSQTFGGPRGTNHPSYGGGLTYSRSNRVSAVTHHRPSGTKVSAQVQGNLWRGSSGRSTLDANAGWSRSFGGPWGASRPNFGGGISFRHRF